MGIFIGILILSLMMLLHELGHYITGRILGFKIIEFSLFMGPVIFSYTSKKTNIKYSLKAFPIGASVRFEGEEGMGEESSDDPDSFTKKPPWKRAIVLSTGAGVNILSGLISLSLLFGIFGFTNTVVDGIKKDSQAVESGIKPGDKVVSVNGSKILTSIDYAVEMGFHREDKTLNLGIIPAGKSEVEYVDLVPKKSSSYFLGITMEVPPKGESVRGMKILYVDPNSNNGNPQIKKGDLILAINGISLKENYDGAVNEISAGAGKPLNISLERDGEVMEVESVAALQEYYNGRGIYFQTKSGFPFAIGESLKSTVSIVKLTFKSIAKIIVGEIAAKDSLSGPVGVVAIVGSTLNQTEGIADKIGNLLWLFALISINLGVFNLLPIPALDGSHLLLLLVEKLRGKPVPQKVQNIIVFIGFALIIALAIMGLIFDIMRLTGN